MTLADLGPAPSESAVDAQLDGIARFVGIEQEFEVWNGDQRVDFRELIHSLPIDGLRLDPGDVNAYRMRSGMVLTCDEAEAEVACPPIPVEPGFGLVGQQWAAAGRRLLERMLPAGYSLRGYSTHINVSLPGPPHAPFAETYARTFGTVFARVIERSGSLGIYVRPRPGRIELCGEFVEGERLGAAMVFAAGTVKALARGVPFVEAEIELLPCVERFGYRVHRSSAGYDTYASGRSAGVPMADGSSRTFDSLLEEAVVATSLGLGDSANPADVAHLKAMAAGTAPLGVEVEGEEFISPLGEPPESQFVNATHHWWTGSAMVEPVIATWAFSVFRIANRNDEAFAVVPGGELASFAKAVDSDPEGEIERLAMAAAGELEFPEQTNVRGVFTGIAADPVALLQPELPTAGGKVPATGSGRIGKAGGRPGKLTGRPWKFVPLPIPTPRSGPPAGELPPVMASPRPASPSEPAPVPLSPMPPAPVPPPPLPAGGGPSKGVIAAVGGAIVAVVVVVGAWAASQAPEDPKPTPTPVVTVAAIETAKPTDTPRPTETPRPTVTPTKTAEATSPASPSPTVAGAAATATSTASATFTSTVRPTETIPATFTATATNTVTPTVRPTETPRPTPTLTPTATPTVQFDPVPTNPPPAGCTPVPGATC